MTPTIVNEFIQKIVIHAPAKSSGKRTQQVDIYYNAVGIIDVHTQEELRVLHEEYKQRQEKTA